MSSSTSIESSSPILDYVQELHKTYAGLLEGTVPTYIPELAKADPKWFGIALVTTSGAVYEVGDSRKAFTIQSISKPFVYGLALEDNTRAEVQAKVGVEPTGDAFNAISLEPRTRLRANRRFAGSMSKVSSASWRPVACTITPGSGFIVSACLPRAAWAV